MQDIRHVVNVSPLPNGELHHRLETWLGRAIPVDRPRGSEPGTSFDLAVFRDSFVETADTLREFAGSAPVIYVGSVYAPYAALLRAVGEYTGYELHLDVVVGFGSSVGRRRLRRVNLTGEPRVGLKDGEPLRLYNGAYNDSFERGSLGADVEMRSLICEPSDLEQVVADEAVYLAKAARMIPTSQGGPAARLAIGVPFETLPAVLSLRYSRTSWAEIARGMHGDRIFRQPKVATATVLLDDPNGGFRELKFPPQMWVDRGEWKPQDARR